VGIFLFTTASKTTLGVKRPRRGSVRPLPQYAFMVWCSVKNSTVTTLPLSLRLPLVFLFEKQHKVLWRQNSLDRLTE